MEVRGAARLAASCYAAARELANVPLDGPAAVIAAAARARAPRRTGALAGSIGAVGPIVRVGVDYGGVIEGGWRAHNIEPQPYVTPAIAGTETAQAAAAERDVQSILDRIRGA